MSNLPATLSNAIGAMQSASAAIDTTMGDFGYLKLTKAGEWVHGSDDDEIADDSIFAVSVDSFFAGFQSWDDGELLGEEIALLTEPPIRKVDLEDTGAEWKPLIGFQLVCIKGADKGLQLVYKTTAKGGIKEVNDLMKRIVAHVTAGKHGGKLVPLIGLAADSYKHKKYGKIYTPIVEIIDWTDAMPETDAAPAADADDDYEDDEPQAVEEEVEVEVEVEVEPEAKPARRRRRRV
jgi:hypothetical protein